VAFGKPVVYVHGDTHTFRIDKPLVYSSSPSRFIENFTRVETFGYPNTHWVRVTIDPDDPNVFRFEQEIVSANRVHSR
jgi:hydroxyacyl-ACP dehydratase HTD2-like protein with hotdog domain